MIIISDGYSFLCVFDQSQIQQFVQERGEKIRSASTVKSWLYSYLQLLHIHSQWHHLS